jgi:Tfp pilus assembly protein PilN
MTTTVLPPDAGPATKNPLRIPPIGTNLLPVEIVESRRNRKVRRLVLAALAVFTALLAMWYGVSALQTTIARGTLADAESDVQRLNRQQRQFGELVQAQSESQAIIAQLSTILADDLQWTALLSSLQQAAPSDVHITMASGSLSAMSAGAAVENPQSARLPSTTADKLVGTLTIAGTAGSKASVAAYMDALGKVPGLADPLLSDVSSEDGTLQFTMQMDITSAAPDGRFAPQPSTAGEK